MSRIVGDPNLFQTFTVTTYSIYLCPLFLNHNVNYFLFGKCHLKLTLVVGCVLFWIVWAFDITILTICDVAAAVAEWIFCRYKVISKKGICTTRRVCYPFLCLPSFESWEHGGFISVKKKLNPNCSSRWHYRPRCGFVTIPFKRSFSFNDD